MAEGLLRHDAGAYFEVASAGLRQRPREACPLFFNAPKILHHSFEDPPPISQGTDEERMPIFRRVRDQLRNYLREFVGVMRGVKS